MITLNKSNSEVKQASSFKAFKDAVTNDLFCCFFFIYLYIIVIS